MANIKFVDETSGNIYDGQSPYIFWFDQGQSTNINYVKRICFVTASLKTYVRIKDWDQDKTFSIVDVQKLLDNNNDLNAEGVCAGNIVFSSWNDTDLVAENNGVVVRMLYIIANSSIAGEFINEIELSDDSSFDSPLTISIGADFYDIDERYKTNLANMGVEIPTSVQKAIYEANLNEAHTDNILMNRKLKELCIEYSNIIANKGSYNSLLNALQWFEWGELVKIYEFWKSADGNKQWLNRTDLITAISPSMQEWVDTHQKTTYIALYAALNKISVKDGKIEYEDEFNGRAISSALYDNGSAQNPNIRQAQVDNPPKNFYEADYSRILQIGEKDNAVVDYISDDEIVHSNNLQGAYIQGFPESDKNHFIDEPNPKLIRQEYMWSWEMLNLKMALLGNFYSTYFMPIHLDLLHSTAVATVYANTIKIQHSADVFRQDNVDNTMNVLCNIADNATYPLGNVNCFVLPETLLSLQYADIQSNDYDDYIKSAKFIGVATVPADTITDEDGAKTYAANKYAGIGVIIPLEYTIKNVPEDIVVNKMYLSQIINGVAVDGLIIDNHTIQAIPQDNGANLIVRAEVLFKTVGDYNVGVAFYLNNGKYLTKRVHIVIEDASYQPISLYRVQRVNQADIADSSSHIYNDVSNINNWAMSRYGIDGLEDEKNQEFSIFLPYDKSLLQKYIGTNHVIRFPIESGNTVTLWSKNTDSVEVLSAADISDLYQYCSHYWWFYGEGYAFDSESPDKPYIVGIRKYFSTDNTIAALYHTTTTFEGTTIDFNVLQPDTYHINIDVDAGQYTDTATISYRFASLGRVFDTLNQPLAEGKVAINITELINLAGETPLQLEGYADLNIAKDGIIYTISVFKGSINTNVVSDDSKYGTDDYKMSIISTSVPLEYVDEERIIPMFHKLVPLDSYKVDSKECLAIVPALPFSADLDNISQFTWKFTNNTTKEEFAIVGDKNHPLGTNQPFIYPIDGNNIPKTFSKGYYKIEFQYSLDGKVQCIALDNAFKME